MRLTADRSSNDTFSSLVEYAERQLRSRLPPAETEQQRVETNQELLAWVEQTFGIRVPAKQCCEGHRAPADAFCDAFFARSPVAIWKGSRGLAGKTFLLALLSTCEAAKLNADITILGGSGQQSARVLEGMTKLWKAPNAPRELLLTEPGGWRTRFKYGNNVYALTASQKSVRGPHPQRLRLDEIDEMSLAILQSAMGQPMERGDLLSQTVMSSTHQYPDGTMTWAIKEAAIKGWPIYEWCYKETLEPHGWLTKRQVERKREELTAQMWQTEVELQEPSAEGRAIDPDAVEWMFDEALGKATAMQLDHGWEGEAPVIDATTRRVKRGIWYASGADWAKDVDYTSIPTLRLDTKPLRLVAAYHSHRRPWPVMYGKFNDRLVRYPGPAAHDATGGGGVISDHISAGHVINFEMVGRARRDLFIDYIAAIEKHEIQAPRIEPYYSQHKFCRADDLYGSGHPPDSVVGMALAYHAYRNGRRPGDLGMS